MRRRREVPAAHRPGKGKRGRGQALLELIQRTERPMLAELVRQLAAISPETERTCFEYLRSHVAKTPDAKAEMAAGVVFTLWSEIEPDLAELDECGGGDHATQDPRSVG